jgi:hypothetical protein
MYQINTGACGNVISEKLMRIARKGRGAKNKARKRGGGVVLLDEYPLVIELT